MVSVSRLSKMQAGILRMILGESFWVWICFHGGRSLLGDGRVSRRRRFAAAGAPHKPGNNAKLRNALIDLSLEQRLKSRFQILLDRFRPFEVVGG
jgi:hypothetical protein